MADELPTTESIFDFLYCDTPRLTSYLSQIDPNGHLTGLKKQTETTSGDQDSYGFDLKVADGERHHSNGGRVMMEKDFDPTWIAPINLLNVLDEQNFINRELENTALGSLCLFSGSLHIFDIRLLREMWGPISRLMVNEIEGEEDTSSLSRQQRRKQEREKAKDPATEEDSSVSDELQAMFEVVRELPHSLQMHMETYEGAPVWTTLRPEAMVMNSDDLSLKHGTAVPGRWICLGIVDGEPDGVSEQKPEPSGQASQLLSGMTEMLDGIRGQFGRPGSSYSVLPLMVFRKVEPNSK